jgi:hypothetical protein
MRDSAIFLSFGNVPIHSGQIFWSLSLMARMIFSEKYSPTEPRP